MSLSGSQSNRHLIAYGGTESGPGALFVWVLPRIPSRRHTPTSLWASTGSPGVPVAPLYGTGAGKEIELSILALSSNESALLPWYEIVGTQLLLGGPIYCRTDHTSFPVAASRKAVQVFL